MQAANSSHEHGLDAARALATALNSTILACHKRPPSTTLTAAALKAATCALKHSHSQHAEDLLLLPTLLLAAGWGRPGVFVELGALDGMTYSNTIALERCFNWSGVLIEGSPSNFAKLQRAERRATKVHSAICNGNGTVPFTDGGGELAADLTALPTRNQELLRKKGKIGQRSVDVPCRSLTSILRDAGHTTATFLSLDVQGAEKKVIASAQPSAFSLIMVETYGTGKAGHENGRLIKENIEADGLRESDELVVFGSSVFTRRETQLLPVREQDKARKLHGGGFRLWQCKKQLGRKYDLVRPLWKFVNDRAY